MMGFQEEMKSHISNIHFRLMTFAFFFRDFLIPRSNILKEAGIKPGMKVLDFGCGPGSYIPHLAESVGNEGMKTFSFVKSME